MMEARNPLSVGAKDCKFPWTRRKTQLSVLEKTITFQTEYQWKGP